MRKIITSLLLVLILAVNSLALVGCSAKDTNSFDNYPVNIDSKWLINKEGYFCLRLNITNNSKHKINYIQASFFWKHKDQDEAILGISGLNGMTLYRYDSDGIEMRGQPKMNIKPGETFSCVAYKLSRYDIGYQFDMDIYVTWINFSGADNWGTKDLGGNEPELALKVPQVDIRSIFQVIEQ